MLCRLRRHKRRLQNPFPKIKQKGTHKMTPFLIANTDQVEFDLDLVYSDGEKKVDDLSATATSSDQTVLTTSIDAGKLKAIPVDNAVGVATVTITDGKITFSQSFQVINPVPVSGEVDLTTAIVTPKTAPNPAPGANPPAA